jgi:mono/diheme cytochrome c family protein
MIARPALLILLLAPSLASAAAEPPAPAGPWAEPGFPFLTSAVDFSRASPGGPVTVRGLIVRLPHKICLCFDLDRTTITGIWQHNGDDPVTRTSIPAISWDHPSRKAQPGTGNLPEPNGWLLPFQPPANAPSTRWHSISLAGNQFRLRLASGGQTGDISWETALTDHGPAVRQLNPDGSTTVLTAQPVPATATWSGPEVRRAWQQPVTVTIQPGKEDASLVCDRIPLPFPNPWQRRVRLSGLATLPHGRAAFCTIDGDVWIAEGITARAATVTWRRFASGLHEPQSLAFANGQLHAFTRDGIIALESDLQGVCTTWRNFCQDIPQSAETREYPMDLATKADGGFYAAKGGQQITAKTPGAGRIYEVSADGRTVTELCAGLRQPYLGIHPASGLLTASDQQGNWIPATPVHRIRNGAFYGFRESGPDPAPPVTEPILWIPHEVNQSAAGQAWCDPSRMGALSGELIHLAYFKPAVFTVSFAPDESQAAALPLPVRMDFPPLKAATNPVDGSLLVCGFQIWGTDAPELSGLARIRPGSTPPTWPTSIRAIPEGIVLTFAQALAPPPDNACLVRSWHYQRSKNYGSPHFKADDSPGEDILPIAGLQLSRDRHSILVHLPSLAPAEQIRIDWNLPAEKIGPRLRSFACLTVHALPPQPALAAAFDPAWQAAPPAPNPAPPREEEKPSATRGRELAVQIGCLACHSTNGSMEGMKGPSWHHLHGSRQTLTDGSTITVDDPYLRESILNPPAKTRSGFLSADTGMPPYDGILSPEQVDSLLLYIRSLTPPATPEAAQRP